MSRLLLDDVARAARPAKVTLLSRAAPRLSHSPYVRRIYAGALSDGAELALSMQVDDDRLGAFSAVLDELITTELGAILPGWRDPTVEGVEAIYLLPWQGHLRRLRIRLIGDGDVPAGGAGRDTAHLICAGDPAAPAGQPEAPVAAVMNNELPPEQSPASSVGAVLVLLHQAYGSAHHGLVLNAHRDMARVRSTLATLLRTSIVAGQPGIGWAGLDEALASTPIGRRCLPLVQELLAAGPPETPVGLAVTVERLMHLVEVAAPSTAAELAGPVDSYRQYLQAL